VRESVDPQGARLSVSLNARQPTWRASIGAASISELHLQPKAGPENVLGKIKFLYPNRHTVYMHDTLAYRKKFFQRPERAIGHDACAWRSRWHSLKRARCR
jgi:murein L,D-transpeptidase YcbB/YkuD